MSGADERETLRVLVAKWRERARREEELCRPVPGIEELLSCAAELEAVLAATPTPLSDWSQHSWPREGESLFDYAKRIHQETAPTKPAERRAPLREGP